MPLNDPLHAEWPATVLVADDEPVARHVLRRALEPAGYRVIEATTGSSALEIARRELPDLFILDISMPDMDGVEVCRAIKADPQTHLTPVVHITGSTLREERLSALEAGSDEFVGKPFDLEELLTRVRSLLRTKRLTDHLLSAEAVMVALARTVEARDLYTERHLRRVADRAVRVGAALGMESQALEAVRLGGLLHDLGKIAVPDRVLLKRGQLSREEFALVRRHPETGAEIVRPLRAFSAPEPVVLHHHEKFDGTGYPYGLRGEEIPLAARVVAVADAFDAMTTDRPYRAGRPLAEAFERLRAGRAQQWDPDAVDAFLGLYAGSDPEEAPPSARDDASATSPTSAAAPGARLSGGSRPRTPGNTGG